MQLLYRQIIKELDKYTDQGDSDPYSEPFASLLDLCCEVKGYIYKERKALEEAWQAGYNAAMAEVVLKTFKKGL